jgi:hypothetical protein
MPAQPEKDEKKILEEVFRDKETEFPVIAESEPEVDKEVESYIEKVEKEIYLSKPITDDAGQPLVSPPAPQDPQIILPISDDQLNSGLKHKVSDSIRWLSEWCLRLVKIFGSRAVFREVKQNE